MEWIAPANRLVVVTTICFEPVPAFMVESPDIGTTCWGVLALFSNEVHSLLESMRSSESDNIGLLHTEHSEFFICQ